VFAPRHFVFLGPNEPTGEIRVLACESASAAEALASADPHGGVVAGPEQPVAHEVWLVASAVRLEGERWVIVTQRGERTVTPASITSVSVAQVGHRRAILFRAPACERPVLLDTKHLSPQTSFSEAQAMLTQLLEDIGSSPQPHRTVRSRDFEPGVFAPSEGDEAASLAAWAVDLVDSVPAILPRRLERTMRGDAQFDLWPGPWLARALHALALTTLGLSLAIAAVVGTGGINYAAGGLLALALAAWGSRRLAWAQWLARQAHRSSVWPMTSSALGVRPALSGGLLDLTALAAALMCSSAETPLAHFTRLALANLVVGAALSAAAIRTGAD
jgi:hypothetical protein